MITDQQIIEAAKGLKVTLSKEQMAAVRDYLNENPGEDDIGFAVHQGIDLKSIERERNSIDQEGVEMTTACNNPLE